MPRAVALAVLLVLTFAVAAPAGAQREVAKTVPWRDSFDAKPGDLSTVGRNTFFILEPGYRLTLEGEEDGRAVRLVVSVLTETRRVGAFDTRVVEERETAGGELAEVSRNYFAISSATGDVYYFGEDVDVYRKGKVVSHEGAWLHGRGGARFGLMMPGKPSVGLRYYQEVAPKVAMDRAEVVSVTETLETRAGTFDRCLKTVETTPLEPGAREHKVYAPGVGLVQDGNLLLASRAGGR